MESLSASNTSFALDLFKKLSEGNAGKNIFFSPWSISTALAMVYLGTKGNTATQMAQHPGNKKDDIIHSGFHTVSDEVNKPNRAYILNTANRIYGEVTYPFLDVYLQLIWKYYQVNPQAVNFIEAAEDARKEINSWVVNQTQNKIQNLLPPGSINSLTKLVLVNAIYFKGNWEQKFLEENTQERTFRLSKTESKPVQMMYQRSKFNISYLEELSTKVLKLPYVNKELSMFILLPDDINDTSTGLEQLEREVAYEKIAEWTSSDRMEVSEVEVELPRIKLEEKYDLRETLSLMGMSDVFSQEKADLSGISTRNNLYVSDVFHKAYLEINEEGTEAAAATGGVLEMRKGLIRLKFEADHPFLFFIRHNKANTILFYGRFCSP
ncbi:serpin B10 [Microcaecilia unicolor]|uniref:Leukocyte elastase inhibitor n=1 Tax=Microcaecilia unicolor TaxID=1415580 RepID=A0A6P7YP51_9AMPH|nr:serpin B10-like [Microcaecilia unicolor]XP_030065005.1 serpin B10-like [Microcaecilia unicolor]